MTYQKIHLVTRDRQTTIARFAIIVPPDLPDAVTFDGRIFVVDAQANVLTPEGDVARYFEATTRDLL